MRALAWALKISAVAIAPASAALPPISALELVERCDTFTENSQTTAGRFCDAYIRGFLAGLSLQGVVGNTSERGSPETFAERAARTRLGITRQKPEFCLPEGTSMDELVERLIAHAAQRELEGVTAEHLLHRMLIAQYPCD